MTIKRAVLITILTSTAIGLLALGIKSGSFTKENLKNSFKYQENNRSRNYIVAKAENEDKEIKDNNEKEQTENNQKTTPSDTTTTKVIQYETAQSATNTNNDTLPISKAYNIQIDSNIKENVTNEFSNIKYTSYYQNIVNTQYEGRTLFNAYALLKINNFKYSTFNFKHIFKSIQIGWLPAFDENIMYTITKNTYIYEELDESLFNININSNLPQQIIESWQLQNTPIQTDTQNIAKFQSINNNNPVTTTLSNADGTNEITDYYLAPNKTIYIIFSISITNLINNSYIKLIETPQIQITDIYQNTIIQQETIDITGLMLNILTMPFTFITQAFNLTLWEGTPYQFNFSNFILSLIAIATLLFIIKLFTSGMGAVGNFTKSTNKPKPQNKNKKE